MRQKLPEAISRQEGFDHLTAQDHFETALPHARAQLVIICQIIDQLLQTANRLQCFARDGQGRAQAEADAVFYLPRSEDARDKVRGNPQRFHARADRGLRVAPIKRSHQADTTATPPRQLKTAHNPPQVVGGNLYVAVVDQNMVVLRAAQHLHQVAHLAVGAKQLRTQHQANRPLRKLRLELFNGRHGRIRHAADAEQDLVWTLILLYTMAGEARIHLRIKTLHRL